MNNIIFFSFLFNILLGLYSIKSNYKSKINIVFSLLAFLNAGIIITNYLVQIRDFTLLWGRFNLFFVIWTPTLFLIGCSILSQRKIILKYRYLISLSSLFSISLLTNLLLIDFIFLDSGYVEIFGPLFSFFYFYYTFCLLYGLGLLLFSYKNASSSMERKKNLIAFFAVLIPISTSLFTNTYFRIFENYPDFMSNYHIFPITNSLMMFLFAYAVLKYGFLKPDVSIKEKLETLRIKILYIVNIIIVGLAVVISIVLIQTGYPLDYIVIETFFITLVLIIFIDASIYYALSKYINEKIVVPIENISKHAFEVGRGNFNQKVGFEGNDEIAILSRQMDEMTEKLRKTVQIRDNFNKALQIEVKNKTEKLEEAYNELKEADKAKKDFIDAIAHELYNPLAIISVSNELINLDSLDSQNKKRIASIQRNIDRLNSLVKEIEEFTLLGKEKQKLKIEKFDLKKLIENISQNFIILANKRNIDFSVMQIGQDLYLEGDKEQLTKVFENLIENAFNFSNEGGTVKIQIEEHENKIEVIIKDLGCGIMDKDINKIFEKFYRAKVDDELKQGIGIGLPISLDIVNRHDGTIVVDSEYGKGSTFTVIIPKRHVVL